MSTVIYYDDKFVGLFDFLLSESIKPKIIEFGINKYFNDSNFFEVNNIIGTSFKYSNRLYNITLNKSDSSLSFYFTYIKDIDFNNFDYFDSILQEVQYELADPSHAAKVFSLVFYVTLQLVTKYKIKTIKFDAQHNRLDKFYNTLMKNKLFMDEFIKLGYSYSKTDDFHIFKAR